MAVLNDIRALFAQCPVLKDLEARTDQLETDAEGYGIFPAGSAIIEQDMRGAATWQYNFIIAATRMTADDILRLDNCNFTEELQDWVRQQNRKGVPLSGDGLSFVSISASNGAFTDWDENFQYGVYKIQGTLIYEKE